MFETWFPAHWTTLKKLIWIRMTALGNAIKTVTGAIVTFTCKSAKPIVNLTASLSPIQDLHGYDAPWPPGGGKNKFDGEFIQGSAIDLTSSSRIVSKNTIYVVSGKTYTFSANNYTDFRYVLNSSDLSTLPFSSQNYSYCGTSGSWIGDKITFTATNDGYVAIVVKKPDDSVIAPSDVSAVNMQFEESASPTTYSPYSNLCPISGWTGCEVVQSGETLCYIQDFVQGSMSGTGSPIGSTIRLRSKRYAVEPNTKYTFKVPSGFYVFEVHEFTSAESFIKYTTVNSDTGTIETSATTGVIAWLIRKPNNAVITPSEVSYALCTPGETATATTYPITFPDAAGTVYGGTLTVNEDGTGTLTVDRAMVEKDASQFSATSILGRYFTDVGTTGQFVATTENLSNMAVSVITSVPLVGQFYLQTGFRLQWQTGYSTKEELTAAMNGSKFIFCGKLATPITIPLTAEQVGAVITTLKGQNTIWVDDSDEISVTYYE